MGGSLVKKIENGQYDQERAFYAEQDLVVESISIDGPRDGESAFKECSNITVKNSNFNLRYPFWHNKRLGIYDSSMSENCRAAIWYSHDVKVVDSKMHGIKALRECTNVSIIRTDIVSPEFGWSSSDVVIEDTTAESEYLFLRAKGLKAKRFSMKGKYSFQYLEDSEFDDCHFETKDALWHSKNVVVRNSIIKGEYLGWYAENLTLINCVIEGTQPLCYCKNLRLIDCQMRKADLSFERSVVEADIKGHIDSVKNPLMGSHIIADSYGDIIIDIPNASKEIIVRE